MSLAVGILSPACGRAVRPGEYVELPVDFAMGHDVSAPIAVEVMEQISPRVWSPERTALCFDHFVPAPSGQTATQQKKLRDWAKRQGVRFFDAGQGVCHQILFEERLAKPGSILAAADSHTCTAGAVGCLAVSIGSTELGVVMATGRLWLMVPETIFVRLEGALPEDVSAKDLALHLLSRLTELEPDYRVIEFFGPGAEGLSLSQRMTVCNMMAESGAKTAIFHPDAQTWRYFSMEPHQVGSHAADFEDGLVVELSALRPMLAAPDSPLNALLLDNCRGLPVQQAYLGSCTNGRLEDLRIAAKILKGKKVHEGVRLLVSPASRRVFEQALDEGLVQTLIEAGAQLIGWSCGACFGGHLGLLGEGERCISATNRNFSGRMGAAGSEVYLAGPAVVAASAVAGKIAGPGEV